MKNGKGMIPNFLIAGAHKSGTTSVYCYLKQHPEIFMSAHKEPDFISSHFVRAFYASMGDFKGVKKKVTAFEDYCRLFSKANGKKAIGEASVSNLYYCEKSIPLIRKYLGEPRIIIMLRNPIDRAFSAYLQHLRDKKELFTFEEALEQEEKRISEDWWYIWIYKKTSLYHNQVKAYINNFKDVKVCLFEDLVNEPQTLMRDLYAFLKVDETFIPDTTIKYNVSGVPSFPGLGLFLKSGKVRSAARAVTKFFLPDEMWSPFRNKVNEKLLVKPEMNPETREYLKGIFREDILRLQDLIGRDLSSWLEARS